MKTLSRHSPPARRKFELSGLNSGVPTPLAPDWAASQSNHALTRSLLLGSPSSGCAPAQSIQAVPTAMYSPVAGFSLVEVVIALGIASFCLVTMLGLIPSGMKSVDAATEQTAATAVISEIVTDLRSTPLGSNNTPEYGILLPTCGTDGATPPSNPTIFYVGESGDFFTNNTSLDAKYGVALSMSNSGVFLTTVNINIWWPSSAPLNKALGSVETTTSVLRK